LASALRFAALDKAGSGATVVRCKTSLRDWRLSHVEVGQQRTLAAVYSDLIPKACAQGTTCVWMTWNGPSMLAGLEP
jgi:hypothetical protein